MSLKGRLATIAGSLHLNPPVGEDAAICSLTLLCTRGDGHPSDAGYAALADLVRAAF